jgi:general secretion pathway protein B
MSFILDALRKSEHARQRQGGPGLAEVAVATPKTKTSVWATAAVALLVANLIAVGVLMLRRGRAPDAADAASIATRSPTASQSPAAARTNTPAPSAAAETATVTTPPPATSAPLAREPAGNVPPMLQPADATAPGAGTRNPLEDEMADGTMPADPVLAERGASVPAGPPAVTEYGTRPGSVIYEASPGGGTAAEPAPDLPTIDDVALQGGVPEMHIDLHVYADNPQERFVFVNKRKYREGETLQEGPRVEEITRNGVVLSQHGRRFILPRQ